MKGAVAVLGMALSLTACGGSGSSGGSKASSNPPAPSASATPATPQATPTFAEPHIAVATCDAQTAVRTVNLVKPQAGFDPIKRYFAFGQQLTYSSLADCNAADGMPGSYLRSAFNADFTQVAARMIGDGDKGRAGIITGTTGPEEEPNFVDRSGVPLEAEGHFGQQTDQSRPAFGPDGQLYFAQSQNEGSRIMKATPTGEAKPQEVPGEVPGPFSMSSDAPFFIPGDPRPQMDNRAREAVAPDGSWAFRQGEGYVYYGKIGSKKHTELNYSTQPGAPFGYLDTKSYLVLNPLPDDKIQKITITGNKFRTEDILTVTDEGDILDPVLSPDGRQIAFLLKDPKSDITTLYTAPVQKGAEPQETETFSDSEQPRLLSWSS